MHSIVYHFWWSKELGRNFYLLVYWIISLAIDFTFVLVYIKEPLLLEALFVERVVYQKLSLMV
jgi:hypothetical protein